MLTSTDLGLKFSDFSTSIELELQDSVSAQTQRLDEQINRDIEQLENAIGRKYDSLGRVGDSENRADDARNREIVQKNNEIGRIYDQDGRDRDQVYREIDQLSSQQERYLTSVDRDVTNLDREFNNMNSNGNNATQTQKQENRNKAKSLQDRTDPEVVTKIAEYNFAIQELQRKAELIDQHHFSKDKIDEIQAQIQVIRDSIGTQDTIARGVVHTAISDLESQIQETKNNRPALIQAIQTAAANELSNIEADWDQVIVMQATINSDVNFYAVPSIARLHIYNDKMKFMIAGEEFQPRLLNSKQEALSIESNTEKWQINKISRNSISISGGITLT